MATSGLISSKGQITIPIEIRHRLGVGPGDRLNFCIEDGRTVLRPASDAVNPFDKYIGILPFDDPAETSLHFWRELRGHDPDDEDLR